MKRDGACRRVFPLFAALIMAACGGGIPKTTSSIAPAAPNADDLVERGRQLVIKSDCAGCHGGPSPDSPYWLAGPRNENFSFKMGACAADPNAKPCFITRPRNLTPDNQTGLGRFSERQIFNALRYGLRPGETPDVEITSTTPGKGNFPATPKYMAPPMPWTAYRHRSDEDLRAIAAYLKRGVKPVSNRVKDSDGPPDFWASAYTPDVFGTYPVAAFPTDNETMPDKASAEWMKKIELGRRLVLVSGCADCHGGFHPAGKGYLQGSASPETEFKIGPCAADPNAKPCFITRPRNLTPDNVTGMGRFSERQIFNALRYGLRPGETPDVEITSTTPGQGNFPVNPKFLAPPMPWPAWRHMSDEELHAIAAYLKEGVKPVRHKVQDSDGPPDFWASDYVPANIGTYPAPKYPAANEVKR